MLRNRDPITVGLSVGFKQSQFCDDRVEEVFRHTIVSISSFRRPEIS